MSYAIQSGVALKLAVALQDWNSWQDLNPQPQRTTTLFDQPFVVKFRLASLYGIAHFPGLAAYASVSRWYFGTALTVRG